MQNTQNTQKYANKYANKYAKKYAQKYAEYATDTQFSRPISVSARICRIRKKIRKIRKIEE
jgi:hypothetical protein